MIHVDSLKIASRLAVPQLSLSQAKTTHLVGPNGSGKSTFLAAISGLLPYQGSITIEGTEVSSMSTEALASIRCYLSQSEQPLFVMDVYQYLLLSAPINCETLSNSILLEIIEYLALKLDIADKLTRKTSELSGGEWQRVRIAGCCIQVWPILNPHARYLFLDEPAAALDIGHEKMLYDLLDEVASFGISVILSNHDLNRTLKHAEHVVLLSQGETVAQGLADEVLTQEWIEKVYQTKVTLMSYENQNVLLFD